MLRLRALASFIFLCLLSVSCLAERSVLEAFPTNHVPVSWTWSGFPAPEKELELSVALKIRNADKLEVLVAFHKILWFFSFVVIFRFYL